MNCYAVYLKLIQYCKSSILQFKEIINERKKQRKWTMFTRAKWDMLKSVEMVGGGANGRSVTNNRELIIM